MGQLTLIKFDTHSKQNEQRIKKVEDDLKTLDIFARSPTDYYQRIEEATNALQKTVKRQMDKLLELIRFSMI